MAPYFSPAVAIALTLFAAAMWGSWMQVVKHLKDYPISGLIFWLYTMSFIFVWGVTLVLKPTLLPEGIIAASAGKWNLILQIVLGGAMMSIGMYISLEVIGKVGLLLSTVINAAVGSLLGIFTSISKEGLPDKPAALPLIIGITVVFVLAGYICNVAAKMRDNDRIDAGKQDLSKTRGNETVTLRVILMMLLSAFLVNGWSIGTATGTASGLPPILTCAYIASGSFISILIFCGIQFTVKRQWKTVLCIGTKKKPLLLSAISAFCHYGGNLIAIYSMPAISATMSFLFGRSSNVWTYFWGLAYGEFSNSKKKTYAVLAIGILLYFIGVLLLGIFTLS